MKSHPIHVAQEVHAALQKLKQEWGCASISEVVRRLLTERATA